MWWCVCFHAACSLHPTLSCPCLRVCSPSLHLLLLLNPSSCPTLCDPLDCSPPGCSAPGILQARILERGAISSSRGLLDPGLEPESPALAGGSSPLSHLSGYVEIKQESHKGCKRLASFCSQRVCSWGRSFRCSLLPNPCGHPGRRRALSKLREGE